MRTRSIVVAVVLAGLWTTQALAQDSVATDRQLFTDDTIYTHIVECTAFATSAGTSTPPPPPVTVLPI